MKTLSLILFGVLVFMGAMIFGTMSTVTKDYKPQPQQQKESDPAEGVRAAGLHFAKEVVPGALVAPSTAQFPWDSIAYSELPGGEYLVAGEVTARNAFNAPIKHQWEVTCYLEGDKWRGKDLKIDGKRIK